jgi:16S rRNA (guanine966-N2)-methyltransferase
LRFGIYWKLFLFRKFFIFKGIKAMTLRIIGGELKGRKLVTAPGMRTRPTADRVREAIFDILECRVRGASALDLFAGTGAMGIEALSRGAESVVFADNNPAVLRALKKNIKNCSLDSRSHTINWDVLKNLNILRLHQPAFNLTFIDPPYRKNMVQPTLSNLALSRCLAKGAMVVIEHSTLEPLPENPPGFNFSDQRRYGKTLVSFLICVV